METVGLRLAHEMQKVIDSARGFKYLPVAQSQQSGAYSSGVNLPDGFDAAVIARIVFETRRCFKHQEMRLAESLNAQNFLRFNVAQSADPRIFETLKNVLASTAKLNIIKAST